MKKLFMVAMTLIIVTSLSFAERVKIGDLYYSLDDRNHTAGVVGTEEGGYYSYYTGDISIPASVDYNSTTYDVTYIGSYAFCESYITSVTIPCNNLALTDTFLQYSIYSLGCSIGQYAFSNCSNLTSVTFIDANSDPVVEDEYTMITDNHIIGYGAFRSCSSLKSISIPKYVSEIRSMAFEYSPLQYVIMENPTPPKFRTNKGQESSLEWVFRENNPIIYVPIGALSSYKEIEGADKFAIHVIDMLGSVLEETPTAVLIKNDNDNMQKIIVSCGIDGGEEEFPNNAVIGLEPGSEYNDIALFVRTTSGDYDTIHYSFNTSPLELITKPSKIVSSTTAILLAETNIADLEVSCGFEYKRNDAPADMSGTKVFCPVANGQMAGRLKNLKDDVYYKYRAFYQSKAGNMYYGDWQYIFTGDAAVEFDPILYTYDATIVKENEATLKGYALAGSEDFTEQGFEYWAESRVSHSNSAPYHAKAALGEHNMVTASGISMKVTLTNLDEGTVYKYRTYAKIGDQVLYGSEMSFTTLGEYEEESVESIFNVHRGQTQNKKVLRNGQIYIIRGDRTYTITGQEVK